MRAVWNRLVTWLGFCADARGPSWRWYITVRTPGVQLSDGGWRCASETTHMSGFAFRLLAESEVAAMNLICPWVNGAAVEIKRCNEWSP